MQVIAMQRCRVGQSMLARSTQRLFHIMAGDSGIIRSGKQRGWHQPLVSIEAEESSSMPDFFSLASDFFDHSHI